MDGVYRTVPNTVTQTVTITFDPEKISAKELVAILEGKGFEVFGDPRFIK